MHVHPYWLQYGVRDFQYPSHLPNKVDILIIGAGLAGLLTAYWLAREKSDRSVVIVDRSPYAGFDSIGRGLGHGLIGGTRGFDALIKDHGVANAAKYINLTYANLRLLEHLVQTFKFKSCEFERNGGLRLALSAKEQKLIQEACEQINNKLDLTLGCLLDKDDILSLLNSLRVHSAMYMPTECLFNPVALLGDLIHLCKALNVKTYFHTNIVHVTPYKNYYTSYTDRDHEIASRFVVHANSSSISTKHPAKSTLVPMRQHCLSTEVLPANCDELFPHMPLVSSDGNLYFRLHNRHLLCSGRSKEVAENNNKNDQGFDPQIFQRMIADMAGTFPITAMAGVEHFWTRTISTTADHLPIIEGHKNEYVISGLEDHETSYAMLGGKLIADQIDGTKKINKTFSSKRFD